MRSCDVMARRTIYGSCLALLCLLHTAAGETLSSCFGGLNKTLDIDCGAGHMVDIGRTFYGFSPSGQCQLVEREAGAGCTVDEHEHYGCVGQQACSINLPTGQWGLNVPTCGQRSNYFQVEYSCVLASSVHNICDNKQLTSQSGYIMTPRYPANYHNQGMCSTTVLAQPSQKLRLHIIDMDLQERSHFDCADLLYFNDKLRSITLCGERRNNSYSMHTPYLHIELQSSSGGHSKGFWLYYEAFPPLPTSLEPPDTVNHQPGSGSGPQTNQPPGHWNGGSDGGQDNGGEDSIIMTTLNYHKSTVPLYRNSNGFSKPLPFAAIAGGVIGTLSLILIILLLMLLVKWCKERRYYKVEKILEIKNPAFRSSGDFHEKHSGSHHSGDFY